VKYPTVNDAQRFDEVMRHVRELPGCNQLLPVIFPSPGGDSMSISVEAY
jgi:hypothetical protein